MGFLRAFIFCLSIFMLAVLASYFGTYLAITELNGVK